jgi:hypothetical protein
MRKKILISAAAATLILGALFLSIPFIDSLGLGDVQFENLPHLDISDIKPGETVEFKSKNLHIYVTKISDENNLRVLAIPFQNKKYWLPEFTWKRAVLPCDNFGINNENMYLCKDENIWYGYMKWNEYGKYVGEIKYGYEVTDLIVPRFEISGKFIVILQS